jgi:NTE family protein
MMEKESLIKELPLFSESTPKELAVILERSSIVEYKKGALIYAEGSAPSAFYCIISGRVLVYTQTPQKGRSVLEYLHRGKYFGIISLLTNEPHSVSAEALNDCLILEIKKDDFDFVLQAIPVLAIDLSRTLSRRLKRKDIHQKTIFESTVVSVFSSYSQAGKTVYALNLALSLHKETHKSVIILDLLPRERVHTLPGKLSLEQEQVFDLSSDPSQDQGPFSGYVMKSKFGVDLACFYYREEDAFCLKKLVEIISVLVNDYHYIIMDLPSIMDRSIINMLNQSDCIHILSSPDPVDLKRTNNLVERLKKEFNFNPGKINIVVNEYKLSKISHTEQLDIVGQDIFATVPKIDFESADRLVIDQPEGEYAKAVRRIARSLGDSLVGLVLGVGVGYGFCHIGVLKVIEEEGIPIDVIAGSSIGSLIASLWATGKSSAEILKITSEFQEPKRIWGLVDVTFPLLGFIKGNKLHSFLKRHLGDKTFYDVRLPLKIIASDVRRKEPKVFDKGLLVDAVMASCAMPGVFAPFKFKGEMLFDGGVINPLPTEALLNIGIKKIIAVNVTPSREDVLRQINMLKDQVSGAGKPGEKKLKWFDLIGRLKNIFKINIVDIIFSSVEVLQSEVARKEGELADVVLHPDTQGLFWLDLHKAKEFAERGEIETRKNLDKIRQLVNE